MLFCLEKNKTSLTKSRPKSLLLGPNSQNLLVLCAKYIYLPSYIYKYTITFFPNTTTYDTRTYRAQAS